MATKKKETFEPEYVYIVWQCWYEKGLELKQVFWCVCKTEHAANKEFARKMKKRPAGVWYEVEEKELYS